MNSFVNKLHLFLIFSLILPTCSATGTDSTSSSFPEDATTLSVFTPATAQDRTDIIPTATYLPLITNNYPYFTIFGVDGRSSLDMIADAQIDWLRVNVQLKWSQIEVTQGSYDWNEAGEVDKILIKAVENGLQPILVIQTSPTWARQYSSSICGPIKKEAFSLFGEFLYKVVQRYSQPPFRVNHYQIWNEPDGLTNYDGSQDDFGCWADGSDDYGGGLSFGKMLSQVYPKVKEANPDAQVILGSLMLICDPRDPAPQDYCKNEDYRKAANFFDGVMKEASKSFDEVMFNSRPSYVPGENPVWSEFHNWRWEAERGGLVNGKIEYIRNTMKKYGVDKPIIHSEAYLLDRPLNAENYNLFEQYKADYLVWVYANGWAQGLRAVLWYSIEGWKGSELVDNGEATDAYQALKAMTSLLKETKYIRSTDIEGYKQFIFQSSTNFIWLLVPTGQQYGVPITIPIPQNLQEIKTSLGEDLTPQKTEITFTNPIYIILGK